MALSLCSLSFRTMHGDACLKWVSQEENNSPHCTGLTTHLHLTDRGFYSHSNLRAALKQALLCARHSGRDCKCLGAVSLHQALL